MQKKLQLGRSLSQRKREFDAVTVVQVDGFGKIIRKIELSRRQAQKVCEHLAGYYIEDKSAQKQRPTIELTPREEDEVETEAPRISELKPQDAVRLVKATNNRSILEEAMSDQRKSVKDAAVARIKELNF
jgi:uncharacterized protein with NAD-binding domain and iron-sulfur cluster